MQYRIELSKLFEIKVTLEEQMICGALQTLNEEACEDVLEESEEQGTIAVATYLQVPQQQPIDIITGEQMQQQSHNEPVDSNYKTRESNSYIVVDINKMTESLINIDVHGEKS